MHHAHAHRGEYEEATARGIEVLKVWGLAYKTKDVVCELLRVIAPASSAYCVTTHARMMLSV